MKKKRIVYVSVFSGLDFLGLSLERNGLLAGFSCERNIYAALMNVARCKHPDGTPVMEIIEITKEEYLQRKEQGLAENVTRLNGKYIRSRTIEEITGQQIREVIEKRYGKDVLIFLIGGPPCQDYTKLNLGNHKGRNTLVFEYLRVLRELQPDVAIMEEVMDITSPKHQEIWDEFIKQSLSISADYQFATLEMNALNYGGHQFRNRLACQWVKGGMPIFPLPVSEPPKRAGELVALDYFFSGTMTDLVKTKDHYMCCITSGSPRWFANRVDGEMVKREPTVDELLMFQGVKPGEIIIPDYIPKGQVRKAIGNGVEVNLFTLLAKTIIEKALRLKHIGDGWFVPIDAPDDYGKDTSNSSDEPGPVVSPVVIRTDGQVQQVPDNTGVSNKTNGEQSSSPILPNADKQNVQGLRHGKIISSEELVNIEFSELPFQGKWRTFFGAPSLTFYSIIHGMAGEGKSTFAIQFASYLADNIGSVLYVSGEEGLSKTFQEKVLNTNSVSKSLFVAELKTSIEIIREVAPDKFKFIFLDSLQHLKIDPAMMRELRAKFKNTAFISISQSTKAGEMRGSAEHAHDADIVIEVVSGVGTITKNRFQEKGTTFNIFEIMDVPEFINEPTVPEDKTISLPKEYNEQTESKEVLELLLKDALEREDFEMAARLRDRISKMKNN